MSLLNKFFLACSALFLCTSTFAQSEDLYLYKEKLKLERKAYHLKIEQEELLLSGSHKVDLNSFFFDKSTANLDCIQWVYQGPGTREEAVEACRGVRDMNCVNWVYQGSSTRIESAKACRNLNNMECVQFVYQGPSSRLESVEACRGRVDMECVKFVYQGSATRLEAVRACVERRDQDHCE